MLTQLSSQMKAPLLRYDLSRMEGVKPAFIETANSLYLVAPMQKHCIQPASMKNADSLCLVEPGKPHAIQMPNHDTWHPVQPTATEQLATAPDAAWSIDKPATTVPVVVPVGDSKDEPITCGCVCMTVLVCFFDAFGTL
jgi:hypothetical protein